MSSPQDGIAAGPDGNVWFGDEDTPAIGRITTSGQINEFSAGIASGSGAIEPGIAPGADGNVWFSDYGAGAIGRITLAGQISEFKTGLMPGSAPFELAADPAGNVWFTDDGTTPAVGKVTPCTPLPCTPTITEFPLTSGSTPEGIAVGSDGNVWFADDANHAIGRITPAGQVQEFMNGLRAGATPYGIAAGADGNLWFTDYLGPTGSIGKVTPCTPLPCIPTITEAFSGLNTGSSPGGIALGADGNMWFADSSSTPAVGRITPGGQITEYSSGLPASSLPTWIAPGPDGNLWFDDQFAHAIGQIGAGAPAASQTPPAVLGSHQPGASQVCAGDTWSTWAGEQPSRTAYAYDGYQWLLDGAPIATGPTYTPTAAEIGHQLSCRLIVTYPWPLLVTTSAQSSAVAVASALPAPTPTPTVTNVKQSHSRWLGGSKLATFTRNHKPPVGTTFSFKLNEQASVSLQFRQKVCKHHHCHTKTRGTLSFTGHAGLNKVFFDGRLSRHKRLKPASYTVVFVAANAAGARSTPRKLKFTIVG